MRERQASYYEALAQADRGTIEPFAEFILTAIFDSLGTFDDTDQEEALVGVLSQVAKPLRVRELMEGLQRKRRPLCTRQLP